MNLYDDNGYVNIDNILDTKLPFIFVAGGRATGKTFTALKRAYERNIKFMYMRRTQTQCDLINKPEFSPFKPINNMFGYNVKVDSVSKYNSAFYVEEESGEKRNIGYTCALSTVSNIRGFDASDVDLLIYDEFIPERHERPLKNESSAFFNAIETIGRNRELQGKPPLQVLCLANANNLANEIFLALKLVTKVYDMKKKGQEYSLLKDRGVGIFLLSDSKISQRKKQTALYRLTEGSNFYEMSVDNSFSYDIQTQPVSRNLREYRPLVTVGEITIYEHKSTGNYYVSSHRSGNPPIFNSDDIDLKRFQKTYIYLPFAYMKREIEFESFICESLLTKYLKL